MLSLPNALRAWGTLGFESVLKRELAPHAGDLPLQQGLAVSNYVVDAPITAVIHSTAETDKAIRVKVGIFYQGIVSGCACENDPTPTPENTEYCVVLLEIDRATAATSVMLLAE